VYDQDFTILSKSSKCPQPEAEWRYYFEPAMSLASVTDSETMAAEADVEVEVHPKSTNSFCTASGPEQNYLANELYPS
jgi:hypothetical protein